jgi:outer membrane receptor protein involved in Fe transport
MTKKTFIFLLTAFILLSAVLHAQDKPKREKRDVSNIKTKITGKVMDGETGNPLESATIQLIKLKDSSRVAGTSTGKDGTFTLEQVPFGKFDLNVSFIGYNTAVARSIMITPNEPELSIGEIKLKAGSEMVTEIEVTAERNMMEMGIDKKVFNVEKDLMSQSGTATDVLKNIPSVTVDADGKVSIRGSGNIKILINGRPSGLLSTDPAGVLDQIPASAIERIEIMNNPSAKFDPEGMSGIINIVLKKESSDDNGYLFNLSGTAGTGDKYTLNTGLSYRTGGFTVYGNYTFRLFNMTMTGALNRTNYLSDSLYFLTQSSDAKMKMLGHLANAGFDYDLDKKNYLGMSLSYSLRDRSRYENSFTNNFTNLLAPSSFYSRNNDDSEDENGLDATLNYKHKFDKKQEELTAMFQYSLSKENNTLAIVQQNLDFNNKPDGSAPQLENDYTDERMDIYTLQADYTLPLKTDPENPMKLKSKVETGYKGYIRRTNSDFRVENYNYTSSSWIPNNLLSNDFLYNEQIHAVYGTYENTYKKFGYQIGLRLEESLTKSEQNASDLSYKNDYFSFFPSIFLKQGVLKDVEVQLSYTRRINRPRTGMLNPFTDYSDPQNLRAGNPYLKPEYINGFELGVVKYFTSISMTTSGFYRRLTDVITRFTTVTDTGTSLTIPQNISTGDTYGVEFITSGGLYKWWFINASASYFRTDLSGNVSSTELNNSGYSWTAKLVSNMTFKDLFDFQLSYFYQGKSVQAQGFSDPVQSLDIAFKKDFMNKRMSLGLRVSDIFNSQRWASTSTGEGYTATFNRKRDSRNAFLTFSYRIGTDDKKMKKKQKNGEDENRNDEGF